MKLKFESESVSSCDLCDKTFFYENEIDWHIRKRHTKWRLGWPALPFTCDLCGTTYIRKSEQKDHIEECLRSSPNTPVEESGDKHEGEASDKEGEDDEVSQTEKTELGGMTLP